jgi:hypothetical protein
VSTWTLLTWCRPVVLLYLEVRCCNVKSLVLCIRSEWQPAQSLVAEVRYVRMTWNAWEAVAEHIRLFAVGTRMMGIRSENVRLWSSSWSNRPSVKSSSGPAWEVRFLTCRWCIWQDNQDEQMRTRMPQVLEDRSVWSLSHLYRRFTYFL